MQHTQPKSASDRSPTAEEAPQHAGSHANANRDSNSATNHRRHRPRNTTARTQNETNLSTDHTDEDGDEHNNQIRRKLSCSARHRTQSPESVENLVGRQTKAAVAVDRELAVRKVSLRLRRELLASRRALLCSEPRFHALATRGRPDRTAHELARA
eukprot:1762776-Rhodomonas_salina.6